MTMDANWYRRTIVNITAAANTVSPRDMVTVSVLPGATNIVYGVPPVHGNVHGQIESMNFRASTATARNMDVYFFRKSSYGSTVPSADYYIDHESFVATDWVTWLEETGDVIRTAASGLKIPYIDSDGTKKFHMGFIFNKTLTSGTQIVMEWTWRADHGEP